MKVITAPGILATPIMVTGIGNLLPAPADSEISVSVKAPDKVQPDSSFIVTTNITEVTDPTRYE